MCWALHCVCNFILHVIVEQPKQRESRNYWTKGIALLKIQRQTVLVILWLGMVVGCLLLLAYCQQNGVIYRKSKTEDALWINVIMTLISFCNNLEWIMSSLHTPLRNGLISVTLLIRVLLHEDCTTMWYYLAEEQWVRHGGLCIILHL